MRTQTKPSDKPRGLPEKLWHSVCALWDLDVYKNSDFKRATSGKQSWEFFHFSPCAELLIFQSNVHAKHRFLFDAESSSVNLWCTLGCTITICIDEKHELKLAPEHAALIPSLGMHGKLSIEVSPGSSLLIIRPPQDILLMGLLKSAPNFSPSEHFLEGFPNNIGKLKLNNVLINTISGIGGEEYIPALRKHFIHGKIYEIVCTVVQNLLQCDTRNAHAENFGGATRTDIIHKAEAIIHKRYASPPSLNELAHSIGTNRNKLSNSFKAEHGKTVFEYCQQYRMAMAKRMLSKKRFSVAQVAAMVGYEHAGNFTSAYKRYFGELPKTTRRQTRYVENII